MITSTNAHQTRVRALEMLYRGRASHLGTSMSIVEMLTAIYESIDVERIKTHDPARDRIIVSKGHGAAAAYSALAQFGVLPADEAATYHTDGSMLSGHVSHMVPGIEHSTGALGHGLPVSVGIALGLRSKSYSSSRVFVIVGDGELQEGSNWEALMLASHLRLANLVILLDNNGISSITKTSDVINMNPIAGRFTGFGFAVHEVDGHDVSALKAVIESIRQNDEPSVMICNTVKGYGIPFAENDPMWHYRTLNDETYGEAVAALRARSDA
jgi:transketolase